MITINFDNLNKLELKIHDILAEHAKSCDTIKITDAADYCDCSVSKISKFVKKLGFENYKQYLDFLYNRETKQKAASTEIERLLRFLENFDSSIVDDFIDLIDKYDKIILFGYGPSFICTQYFEYKLRIATSKSVVAVPDEVSADRLLDEHSLLVIFSATGQFRSFDSLKQQAACVGAELLLIVEEYNPTLLANYSKTYMLTQSTQPAHLTPYQKTRTIFFIFIEEVLLRLLERE